ncbi:hypothetical protein BKA82DRAFT_762499 [Pisolithus tinctorius]|nr:hypothetical protein BKA82DRAFT_4158554 [Pisolithus tinctorius]KAI6152479.1 hypothetical protein BKA82DRAFT_762499 [Pisolithus tinctorius]
MLSTHLLKPILFLFSSLWAAKAFSVSMGTASECSPFTISWTGGQSTFEIAIYPADNPPIFYSATSSPYTISQLPLSRGTQFVVMMSDATGFATGGTTAVLTVGEPTSSSSCSTTPPSLSYIFIDDTLPLQQCAPLEFSGYQGAILPVTFIGIIPEGESFRIQSDVATMTYNWTADVPAGTSIMFSMLDANNKTGGCSALQTVNGSSDASCLSSISPSSTGSIPQSSQSGSPSPSASQTGSSSSTTLSTAAIAGVVGGCVVALAALVILGLYLIRRTRKDDTTYSAHTAPNTPSLHLGDFRHSPDTSATAYPYYPVQYQSNLDQSFAPSDHTMPRMNHPSAQEAYSFPRASANLQRDPFAGAGAPNFPAYNDTGMPSGPPFARYARHNVVEHAPPTTSQAIDFSPQYPRRPGPAAGQQSPPWTLSSGTDLAYVPKSFDQIPRHLLPTG